MVLEEGGFDAWLDPALARAEDMLGCLPAEMLVASPGNDRFTLKPDIDCQRSNCHALRFRMTASKSLELELPAQSSSQNLQLPFP